MITPAIAYRLRTERGLLLPIERVEYDDTPEGYELYKIAVQMKSLDLRWKELDAEIENLFLNSCGFVMKEN